MRWHPYKNIDPFNVPEIAEKLLNEYWDIAEKLKIQTFLLCGTCLGFVRDGGFIIGDNDIDVGILGGLEDLAAKLIENGFVKKTMWPGRNCHFLKYEILLDVTFGLPPQFLQTFDRVIYKDRAYNVPHPVEEYLTAFYGNWKIRDLRKVWKG